MEEFYSDGGFLGGNSVPGFGEQLGYGGLDFVGLDEGRDSASGEEAVPLK